MDFQDDPVQAILNPVKLPQAVKAQLWDVFHQAKDADDLQARLDKLQVPRTVKAALWDAKSSGEPAAAAPAASSPVPRPAPAANADPDAVDSFGVRLTEKPHAGRPVSPDDFKPDEDPNKPGLLRGVWDVVNPIPMLKAIYDDSASRMQRAEQLAKQGHYVAAVGHVLAASPAGEGVQVVGNMAKAQWDQLVKARDAYRQGRTTEAAAYLAAGALPLMGPMAAGVGEAFGKGNDRYAAGKAIGLLGSVLAPELAGKVLPKSVGIKGRPNPNPIEAAAADFAAREGIPLSAGQATANDFIRGAEALADQTPIGSQTAGLFKERQAAALAKTAGRITDRLAADSASPESAGEAVSNAVVKRIADEHAKASAAYEQLRAIEADPKNLRPIEKAGSGEVAKGDFTPTSGAGTRFGAGPGATVDDVFEGVVADARRTGFTGTVRELRKKFDTALADGAAIAQELGQSVDEYGPQELFKAIRDAGGIGADDGFAGEIARLWENSTGTIVKPGFNKRGDLRRSYQMATGGLGGVGKVLKKSGGLPLDSIAEELAQDPRFAHLDSPHALLDAIDEALVQTSSKAAKRLNQTTPVEDALQMAGVRPGERWWAQDDVSFNPSELEAGGPGQPAASQTEYMPLPVDMRVVKRALKPVRDRWLQTMPQTQREASPGLLAMSNILEGPDFVPASIADTNLSMLKGIARGAATPELRDVSQGLAANAVKLLDKQVRHTVSQAGPDALQALEDGRAATVAKYRAADVLEQIGNGKEPVAVYKQALQAGDQGINRLRAILREAPEQAPTLARAWMDQALERMTAEGGVSHVDRLAGEWQKLGPETKRLLFGDAAPDVDHFWTAAKLTSRQANTSRTALVQAVEKSLSYSGPVALAILNPATGVPILIGSNSLSALLRSKPVVRALTAGFRVPIANKAASGLAFSRITTLAKEAGVPLATAAENRGSEEATTARR